MEKYYNEKGEVGVIVSPSYGAGFSTWAKDAQICFDKDIIECIINKDYKKFEETISEKYNEDYFEKSFDELVVEFLKPGTIFEIREYDGSEYLRVISYPDDFLVA